MKKEFTIFIIGLLLGAIIATGSILIYTTVTNTNNTSEMQQPTGNNGMPGGNTPPNAQNDTNSTTQAG